MGVFVHLGDDYINTAHIVRIYEIAVDETICIELDSGLKLTVPDRYLPEIMGNSQTGA